MFFEYNLPTAPLYWSGRTRAAWKPMREAISTRFDALEKALTISGLRGEDFSAALANAMPIDVLIEKIRTYTPEKLASLTRMLCEDRPREPDRLTIPADIIVDIRFVTNAEWVFIRCIGLGQSESSICLGTNKYGSKHELYQRKTDFITYQETHKTTAGKQFIFDYGHVNEDFIRKTFAQRAGVEIVPEYRMFRSRRTPCMLADFDGIVRTKPTKHHPHGQIFLFEAKTTSSLNSGDWACDAIPGYYLSQVRGYLYVAEDFFDGAYIACLSGNTENDFQAKFIPRDEDEESLVAESENAFWNDHVLAHNEPPVEDVEDVNAVMAVKFPKAEDKAIALGANKKDDLDRYAELSAELSELSKKEKRLKEERDALAAEFKAILGDAAAAEYVDPDGYHYKVTWGNKKKTETDLEKLKVNYPEAYDDCVKVGTVRGNFTMKRWVPKVKTK